MDEDATDLKRLHYFSTIVRGNNKAIFIPVKTMQKLRPAVLLLAFKFYVTTDAHAKSKLNQNISLCLGLGRWNVNGQQH